jgi:hypothetical protein
MENNLWNKQSVDSVYRSDKAIYKIHILEQYKIYVEMADRISSRRNLANVFFLTINTTLITVVGFLFTKINSIDPKWLIIFPLIAVTMLNVV